MTRLGRKLSDTTSFLQKRIMDQIQVGVILGSGLGELAEEITEGISIPYKDIPHFPVSTVSGHMGHLVIGYLSGQKVMAMRGRFHYYEGYSLEEVTYPVRVMQRLGIKVLVVTNAAGGINDLFHPGDLMLINDHINLIGHNPLRGENQKEAGPRFPDMSEAYHRGYRELARDVSQRLGIPLHEGVYAGVTGPSYETPAEIRYLRIIGADAVGMSTVPEVIVGNHGGQKVLGISCITNMASGVLHGKLNHREVIETADRSKDKFIGLIKGILGEM
ncbi:MAG: purine-nucleoside phosphorylase [Bacillota bacterium]